MKYKIKGLSIMLAVLMIFTAMFQAGQKKIYAATNYVINNDIAVYGTAYNATNRINSTGTYPKGTYFIYTSNGKSINITRREGFPGGWINPDDNKLAAQSTQPVKPTQPAPSKAVVNPLALVNGYIYSASADKENLTIGETLSISVSGIKDDINEYSIDDMTGKSPVRISEWTTSENLKYIAKETGRKILRLNSRNKYKAAAIEDSRNFIVTIGNAKSVNPLTSVNGYIYSADSDKDTLTIGEVLTLSASGIKDGVNEYSIDDMTGKNPVRVSDWTTSEHIKYTAKEAGRKILRLNSRNRYKAGSIEDSRNFVVNIVSDKNVNPLALVNGYIYSADSSKTDISVGESVIISARGINDNVNEYSIDDMTGKTAVRLTEWTTSDKLKYTAKESGKKIIRLNSRNKYKGGAIEDSRNFIINVKAPSSLNPLSLFNGYISSAQIDKNSVTLGQEITVSVSPTTRNINEYSVDDVTGKTPVRVSDWTRQESFTFTAKNIGRRVYRINSRNRYKAGAIEDSRNVVVNVNKVSESTVISGDKITLPSGLGSRKSYERYQMIKTQSSLQYKLQNDGNAKTGAYGIRYYNGLPMIAISTTYANVGDKVEIVFSSGQRQVFLVGDAKNIQGDYANYPRKHAYSLDYCLKWGVHNDGSIIEPIVDGNAVDPRAKLLGSYENVYRGYIVSVQKVK